MVIYVSYLNRYTIDIILANGKLEEDKYVGYIQFNDGKRRELYYH